MRDGDAEGAADLSLVENAVGRAGGLRRILAAPAGPDVATVAGEIADGAGEVVPRADALVRIMIDALRGKAALSHKARNQSGQIRGRGRRADLVEDDRKGLPLGRKPHHGLDEILAVRGIEPRRPEDQIAAARLGNGFLAEELGRAVDAEGGCRPVLGIGLAAIAVEHVIRRDVDQDGVPLLCDKGEVRGGAVVEEIGHGGIALGALDIGIGGAVDDDVHMLALADQTDRIDVRDVQIEGLRPGKTAYVGKEIAGTVRQDPATDFPPELTVRTGHKDMQFPGHTICPSAGAAAPPSWFSTPSPRSDGQSSTPGGSRNPSSHTSRGRGNPGPSPGRRDRNSRSATGG